MGWASKKDCYPFIFTNIKGPILVKEEDMDTYIRNHEDVLSWKKLTGYKST